MERMKHKWLLHFGDGSGVGELLAYWDPKKVSASDVARAGEIEYQRVVAAAEYVGPVGG
jgi:hypothetical protein